MEYEFWAILRDNETARCFVDQEAAKAVASLQAGSGVIFPAQPRGAGGNCEIVGGWLVETRADIPQRRIMVIVADRETEIDEARRRAKML